MSTTTEPEKPGDDAEYIQVIKPIPEDEKQKRPYDPRNEYNNEVQKQSIKLWKSVYVPTTKPRNF